MEPIRIDVSVSTPLEVDLTEFDFSGVEKVVMTIRNMLSESPVCTREFTIAELHHITITPQESERMRADAEYDFDIVTTDGRCYKNGNNGKIRLRQGVGRCQNSE